ncbi:hypothetical protein [Pseudomonas leptonychotis]|uniref:hypothetical protein n=1 Tax=Pseudomonas leptonychotis TaxID=2448482 RepID=UPI00386DBF14
MDKFRFRVVGIDIDHDLTRYPEGSTIELTLDAAYERRRWLELIGPVEDDKQPAAPTALTLPEPPAFTSAAFVSGPTGVVTTSQEQPPAPPSKEVEEQPSDKSVAKPAAKKPAEKGASK